MLEAMSDSDLEYWIAYERLNPAGHQDRLLALIAQRLFNRTLLEGEDPYRIDDFLPIARTPEERMKIEEAKMLAEMGKK